MRGTSNQAVRIREVRKYDVTLELALERSLSKTPVMRACHEKILLYHTEKYIQALRIEADGRGYEKKKCINIYV